MERFYGSEYSYCTIIYKIKCSWGDIRDSIEEMAEDSADYTEDCNEDFTVWKEPTDELEEWLDENESTQITEEEGPYYNLKKLDQIVDLYIDAYSHTGWFYTEVNNIIKQLNELTSTFN